jgi:hypothetical protein
MCHHFSCGLNEVDFVQFGKKTNSVQKMENYLWLSLFLCVGYLTGGIANESLVYLISPLCTYIHIFHSRQ